MGYAITAFPSSDIKWETTVYKLSLIHIFSIPNRDTVFHLGDQLFVVCAEDDAEAIIAFIGPKMCIRDRYKSEYYVRYVQRSRWAMQLLHPTRWMKQ